MTPDDLVDLPAAEGARRVALALLAEADAAAGRLAAGADAEALHDFRVALRRLRSTLRAWGAWLAGRAPRKAEGRLGKLARATNASRDAEVLLAFVAEARRALPSPRHRPGLDLVAGRAEERARGGLAASALVERYGRTARKLRRRLADGAGAASPGAGDTFGAVLADRAEAGLATLEARLARVRGARDREHVHRARIAGKRLRYLLEPLRGAAPADASDLVKRLKRLQDVLGELHDTHVWAEEVEAALQESLPEAARLARAARWAEPEERAAAREALAAGPAPGLVALARRVRRLRDERWVELRGPWREAALASLQAEAHALVASLRSRPAAAVAEPSGTRDDASRAAARPG
jgi:CHAD domain-containing protein